MGTLVLNGATSGSTTLQPTDATTQTITLPANSGTVITTQSSGKVIPTAALPAGTVLQVVQGTTSTPVTVATSTYTDIGLSATITPTSSSSKILVIVTTIYYVTRSNAEEGNGIKILRDSTSVWDSLTWLNGYMYAIGASQVALAGTSTVSYLDSPNKSTATVYKVQGSVDNTANGGQVQYQVGSKTSTITLMEIAQ